MRFDYLVDPNLGESAFDHDLTEAREKIGHALSTVFRVAAVGSAIGVLLALYTFSGMRKEEDGWCSSSSRSYIPVISYLLCQIGQVPSRPGWCLLNQRSPVQLHKATCLYDS